MARTWSEEDKAEHSRLMKEKHAAGEIPSSKDSIKGSRGLNSAKEKVKALAEPAAQMLHKAIFGGFVRRMEIWLGTEEQKCKLSNDPTAIQETSVLDDGREVPVLVYYTAANHEDWERAKWLTTQEIALEKAAVQARLDKVKLASTKKKAIDEGALPKENPQEAIREEFEKRGLKALSVSAIPPEKVAYPTEESAELESEYGDD